MDYGEAVSRMAWKASHLARDGKKSSVRMLHTGQKRPERPIWREERRRGHRRRGRYPVIAGLHFQRGTAPRDPTGSTPRSPKWNPRMCTNTPQGGGALTDAIRMALIEKVSKRRNLWDIAFAAYKDKQRSEMDWHYVREKMRDSTHAMKWMTSDSNGRIFAFQKRFVPEEIESRRGAKKWIRCQ
ncbi:unnamed protein product [Heligmosomoides polygyrus]|uniref:MADF domain-containing protein n=1 Tax=Heligmosomoides polygyrus TaxID=6339 RepID=A0A183F204_HELPZ|nr:unnamed protein product [Heligmosomoides polygyrus]